MTALSWQDIRRCGVRGHSIPESGITLLELLVTLAVLAILFSVATPLFVSYYAECCLKAAMWEIAGMVREAKQCALNEKYYAISFNHDQGKISLLSGRGADGEWNTADDEVVRSLRLRAKGGNLSFGYGACGPIPGYAASADGISFPNNNTIICNPELTGNAGTVYIRSRHGSAMALTINSEDFGYTLRRWNGSEWVLL